MKGEEVTIRQNCYFDYMHVYDLAKIIDWFIEHIPNYNDYNICSGIRYSLFEIAEKVCYQMGNNKPIRLLSEGLNKEYTADNSRLLNEMKDMSFLPLDEGIAMQIEWEKEHFNI
jgi:GDP-L-fucose synthase